MAFIYDLIFDIRKREVFRYDRILPCHHVIGDFRVMVPVPIYKNLIIQRMVRQDHFHLLQQRQLILILRKEPYIKVRGLDLNPVRFCRIKDREGLGNVFRLVRILQPGSQDDLFMRQIPAVMGVRSIVGAGPDPAARP